VLTWSTMNAFPGTSMTFLSSALFMIMSHVSLTSLALIHMNMPPSGIVHWQISLRCFTAAAWNSSLRSWIKKYWKDWLKRRGPHLGVGTLEVVRWIQGEKCLMIICNFGHCFLKKLYLKSRWGTKFWFTLFRGQKSQKIGWEPLV